MNFDMGKKFADCPSLTTPRLKKAPSSIFLSKIAFSRWSARLYQCNIKPLTSSLWIEIITHMYCLYRQTQTVLPKFCFFFVIYISKLSVQFKSSNKENVTSVTQGWSRRVWTKVSHYHVNCLSMLAMLASACY